MTTTAITPDAPHADDAAPVHGRAGPWLGSSASWDRWFLLGGALLVPLPIVTYYLLRGAGLSVGVCEDLVTLMVMLAVGGPHVFATYTRTYLDPKFALRERWLWLGGFAVVTVVLTCAVTSAFFDVTVQGRPPMQYLLTFFFFWAGIHVMHQHSYLTACYSTSRGEDPARSRSFRLDAALMLCSLFPIAFFRMSMVDPGDTLGRSADPDALATWLVADGFGFGQAFADDYVFRIGRVAPALPEIARHPVVWVGIALAFLGLLTAWAVRTVRAHRAGTLHRPRAALVGTAALVAFLVPLFPNLDTAFQGINAWHSAQYLGLVWLWNRNAFDREAEQPGWIRRMSAPGRARRFYLTGLGATLFLVGMVFLGGYVLQELSGGRFVLFGHETAPTDPESGTPLYRPGSLLLAYYAFGFSLLLVHYLHDGFFFFRTKDLVRRPG